MTAHDVPKGAVGTPAVVLVASTVETVTFLKSDLPSVEVISPASNTADVWYTLDGSAPTVGGTNSYYLPPGSVDIRRPTTSSPTTVKLISTGTPTVRVQRGD